MRQPQRDRVRQHAEEPNEHARIRHLQQPPHLRAAPRRAARCRAVLCCASTTEPRCDWKGMKGSDECVVARGVYACVGVRMRACVRVCVGV